MSKELDRIRAAFRSQEPIRPRAAARRKAIDAATGRFARENSAENAPDLQGSADGGRLKSQGGEWTPAWNWRRMMNAYRPQIRYALAGGASLIALALVIGNPGLLTRTMDAGPQPSGTEVRRSDDEAGGRAVRPGEKDAVTSLSRPIPRTEPENKGPAPVAAVNERREQFAQEGLADRSAGQVAAAPPTTVVVPSARVMRKMSQTSESVAPVPVPADRIVPQFEVQGRDRFSSQEENPIKLVAEAPVSTFSVDVDTASYAFMRSSLEQGVLPPKNSVRIEELVNYFDYDYAPPTDRSTPFNAEIAMMPTPWNAETRLLRIGIKGYDLPPAERPHANLVFLIDTSGSMNQANKLPLLRNAFKLMLSSLHPDDTVAIVTYAGSAGTALEPTPASESGKIMAALDRLSAGGSTAGAEGIRQAYRLAEDAYRKDGVNRVILATDGDFNVGISDVETLKGFIERKRETGISLSVLGFGRGNYNDEMMQALAQNGNGNAAYIDTLNEARKVLVEQVGSTLFTIAGDVKLQLEFNPAVVRDYRLIGYETRHLEREDFNNDRVDAGDIGAGHEVTALYEISPVGADSAIVDPLRYGKPTAGQPILPDTSELGFLKIRYKLPGESESKLIERPIPRSMLDEGRADDDMRFAAAVAAFGELLRGGKYAGTFDYDDVIALAGSARGQDAFNYRGEFLTLARLAKTAAAMESQR